MQPVILWQFAEVIKRQEKSAAEISKNSDIPARQSANYPESPATDINYAMIILKNYQSKMAPSGLFQDPGPITQR